MKKLVILVLLFSASCSGVNITGVEKANDFSISKYKTFSFYEVNRSGNALGSNYESNLKLLMEAITRQMTVLDVSQLWVNPDCGLKTRQWAQVKPALANMVVAARQLRERVGQRKG